ncbi:MAG: 5-methyltetrahydropteroyltriglutamate--homocysteine S-methyltransferase, partial [Alphaproteobacteria bacterium]
IEDRYVDEVVKLQEDVGMPVVTDGEFRRRSWWTDYVLSLTNTSVTYNSKLPITWVNAKGDERPSPGIHVGGKVQWQRSILAEPFKYLKQVARRTPKVTIPAPPIIHYFRDENFVPGAYADIDKFWDDVVKAYRLEIKALADAGCRHIQLDEVILAWLCDPRHQALSRTRGDDPVKLVEKYAWVINQAIAERPKDMVVGLHLCRGNLNAFWGGEGGYEPVADAIFNKIDADIYLLEYDTARAGDFKPLRHVPKGKKILLGIVSTKDKTLESKDEVRRRIEDASKHLDHAQLGLCPQCGFSTNIFGTEFSIEDEKRKLGLIVEVADREWK